MFDTVLIPTDGSEGSEIVVDQGIDVAKRHDAAVHGLFVVDTRAFLTLESDLQAETTARLRDEGERALAAITDAATAAGLDATVSIREGSPSDEIVAYADEAAVDLIVMGSHADYERNMLGSVSSSVVQESPVSVLTVKFSGRDV
ncbi:universal stress protein [Salinirubrum litoreum]|uniref:Universal stress protein n=1 Tax=Salinirubrum litoreum TaxID=1126234 RepID=A0ABD5R717_9EURY|nr:universal stress protein [Salinirubrum litoreum]